MYMKKAKFDRLHTFSLLQQMQFASTAVFREVKVRILETWRFV